MHCYQRIRDCRNDKDFTQKEIAEILGINQRQYSRYEIGYVEIPLHYLITLADYYNVSVDYLIGRTNIKERYPKSKQDWGK